MPTRTATGGFAELHPYRNQSAANFGEQQKAQAAV